MRNNMTIRRLIDNKYKENNKKKRKYYFLKIKKTKFIKGFIKKNNNSFSTKRWKMLSI